jgi:tetratricopeptide (TPR) repeat protein
VAQQRAGRAIGALALGALVIVLAGGLVAAGNPVTRLEHAWHSFKGGYGSEGTHANRLASGLGSNRYDFYRVSVDEFLKHPVAGIGADNFAQQYLEHGRSTETPHYPHSIELRTLVQTGLIGGLIALTGLIAALAAAWRATRLGDPLARTVAAAALAGFGCWAVHGSFDWFFEFAGLGAPAFAMLGLLCGLVPKSEPAQAGALDDAEARDAGSAAPPQRGPDAVAARRPRRPAERSRGRLARALVPAIAGVGALAVAVTFAGPWLSQLQVQSAARVWTRSPSAAYSRLADAARLNPFSDEAYLVAGSIALRLDEVDRADREFARALKRTPSDAYATLERGAIASTRGERAMALSLLMKAERLDPRDELTRAAARLARSGKTVSVQELNRSILLKAQELS